MRKTVEPELVQGYKKEQILELARRSLTSVKAHFALFVFVAVITPLRKEYPVTLACFGLAIFLVSGLRIGLARKIPAAYEAAPGFWTRALMAFNLISGAIWGVLGCLMGALYGLDWPFMFILVINSGLAAGATSSLGPHLALSRLFTLSILVPVTAWGFVHGSSLGFGMGGLCLFSMVMFMRMAKDNYLWYWDSVAGNQKIQGQAMAMETLFSGIRRFS